MHYQWPVKSYYLLSSQAFWYRRRAVTNSIQRDGVCWTVTDAFESWNIWPKASQLSSEAPYFTLLAMSTIPKASRSLTVSAARGPNYRGATHGQTVRPLIDPSCRSTKASAFPLPPPSPVPVPHTGLFRPPANRLGPSCARSAHLCVLQADTINYFWLSFHAEPLVTADTYRCGIGSDKQWMKEDCGWKDGLANAVTESAVWSRVGQCN